MAQYRRRLASERLGRALFAKCLNETMTELPEVRSFRELGALKIQGYYTSKIGIHDDLDDKRNRMIVEYVGLLRRNQANGQPSGKRVP